MSASDETLLQVNDLHMEFRGSGGLFGRRRPPVRAVSGVTMNIQKGETLGLVGESGCGKTTLGRCILRAYKPTSGEMIYHREDGSSVDLASLSDAGLRPFRRDIRTIFQDPNSSLNPRMTILQIIGEPLRVNKIASGSELEDRVAETLRLVGLRPEYIRRYPHAFSGGERQRIGIARALVTQPRLVVADEAVSALDVSVRSQILNLLEDLQEQLGLTYLFVSHDLSVIEHLCDRVAVMYVGRMVEQAVTEALYSQPRHPYTEALMAALPKPDPRLRRLSHRESVRGEVPDLSNPPSGCTYHPRCSYAQDRCSQEEPGFIEVDGHRSRCWFAADLNLVGAVADEESA